MTPKHQQLSWNVAPAPLSGTRFPTRRRAGIAVFLILLVAGPARAFDGLVVSVADGDTLTLMTDRTQVKVRLADIDAPERGQAFGTRSRQALSALCFQQRATVAAQSRDRYGRTVGRVNCNGIDANAAQVRSGMAWVFRRIR
jgi:micrococcal nuclease